jgi:hypothetical protein
VRPDKPTSAPEEHKSEWTQLTTYLHEQAIRLYNDEAYRLEGDLEALSALVQVDAVLPPNHPLKEKVRRAALLHGVLYKVFAGEEIWNVDIGIGSEDEEPESTELPSDLKKWVEENLKNLDLQLPPPPEQKGFQPFKVPKRAEVEGIPVKMTDLSVEGISELLWEQWYDEGLGEKWKRWAEKMYGGTTTEAIVVGFMNRLVDKLLSNKEVVEALVNSPLNFSFASVDDALKRKDEFRDFVSKIAYGLTLLWSQTACDEHPLAYALQLAIAQEFGLRDKYEALLQFLGEMEKSSAKGKKRESFIPQRDTSNIRKEVAFLYHTFKPILHAIVREIYDQTQDFLAKSGLKRLRLVRGVGFPVGKTKGLPKEGKGLKLIAPPFFPASAWTIDGDVARGFAELREKYFDEVGFIYYIEIPKSAFPCILATALTGLGCPGNYEVVLMLPEGQQVWSARYSE